MGDYTAWEIFIILILVAVVLWAGRMPGFIRRLLPSKKRPGPGAGPDGGAPAA